MLLLLKHHRHKVAIGNPLDELLAAGQMKILREGKRCTAKRAAANFTLARGSVSGT